MTKPNAPKAISADSPSTRYQDYVISEGRFVGQFEDMYRHSAEVPWHQDETVNAVFSDLTVALLKRRKIESLLDVGCGLGYMAERLRREIPELKRVVGIDVSETAINKARSMFPDIVFVAGNLQSLHKEERFQMVVSKDVLWYVLDDLPGYLSALVNCSSRWVYIGQSFPEQKPFYGDQIIPDAETLFQYIKDQGLQVVYSLVERDADYDDRQYAHVIIKAILHSESS